MRAFDSIAKKLAIPMVVLFQIGWIIYIGGFGAYMHQQVNRSAQLMYSASSANEILREPGLFPFYFTLVGGQFVALLFLLHAALPSSIVSYIIGILSSVLNIIFFVSVGYLIHWSVPLVKYLERYIRESQQSASDLESEIKYLHALRCILAGAVIMSVVWGVIQLLFFFYEDKSESQNQRTLWCVIREFVTSLPTSTSQLKASPGELVRACIVPVLVLSAIGWCVCVAGLYKLNDNTSTSSISSSTVTSTTISERYDLGTWSTFFIVPILYLATLLHVGFSGDASTMSGVFAAILNTFFVLNVGFKVLNIAILLYYDARSRAEYSESSYSSYTSTDSEVIYSYNLILGGGAVCLFFWTVVYAAWNFYRFKQSRDHTRLQPGDIDNGYDHSQMAPHVQQYYGDDTNVNLVPEQYAKHQEAEMQPVAS